ncbi:MAG TPA: methylmalonyl-CoA mutase family protein [Anaerolineales bacterium]|nr:methylmalonyl-CoA mutase family protein [Anaerolineales bacterium]
MYDQNKLNDLKNSLEKWEETSLQKALASQPERQGQFITTSSEPINRLYTPLDVADLDYFADLGNPGEYPYTRGVHPTLHRSKLWTMRMFAGFGTAEETNARFKYLLDQGQTGLSVAFDLATLMGYDSADPLAAGEVGQAGVAIDSLADMEAMLEGIPLDKVSISMTINAPASVLLAMVIATGEKRGVPANKLTGTIQNDILKEYVARGTYIFPPAPSMRLITDIFSFCEKEVPNWNTISISGYHIREAGSTAVQEVAFTLANGIAYVESALKAGLNVDEFAGQLSFFFNAHNNFLEEVAKFRAARRLWANIMRERFKAQKPSSWQLRFHTQTAGSTLTAQQPENNVVRVTVQALSAVLGGTQSLHTNSMDEALWLPTEKAVRVALRTQQILAYESGVADSVDPLAGSYLIEYLTDEIEKGAQEYISKIDDMGGALQAIEKGFMQSEIQNAAYAAQQAIERGEQVVVGVNQFAVDEEVTLERLRVDPAIELGQRERLKKLRETRDQRLADELLGKLKSAASGTENLMPLFIECVENDITLGEICNALRVVWGEYVAEGF